MERIKIVEGRDWKQKIINWMVLSIVGGLVLSFFALLFNNPVPFTDDVHIERIEFLVDSIMYEREFTIVDGQQIHLMQTAVLKMMGARPNYYKDELMAYADWSQRKIDELNRRLGNTR